MLAYLFGWNSKKNKVFSNIALLNGGAIKFWGIGLSFRSYPETEQRVEQAIASAKRQPKSMVGKFLKKSLIRAQYNWSRRLFDKMPNSIAMCWNGITGSRKVFMDGAADAKAKRLFVELAPIPNRVTIDPCGVNYSNSVPRQPAYFSSWAAEKNDRSQENWRRLKADLVSRQSRRSDVAQDSPEENLGNTPYIFCPLQVPNDSQVRLYAGWCKNIEGYLTAVEQAAINLPDGWHIRIKEHPSAREAQSNIISEICERSSGRIKVDNSTDTFAQVENSRGVLTINSSVGLQAFYFNKPVIVVGQAFFGIEGLVNFATDQAKLNSLLRKPEKLTFDPTFRNQFMNYITDEYFIEYDWDAGIFSEKGKSQVKKLLNTL